MSHAIDFEPIGRRGQAEDSETILKVVRRYGVGLSSLCGGAGTCGRCRVQILQGETTPVNAVEEDLLSADELKAGYRLGCQVYPLSDLKIHIPPEALTAEQRTQVEGQELAVALEPLVSDVELDLPPPSLTDIRSDEQRLRDYLSTNAGGHGVIFDFELLRVLSPTLREFGWQGRASLRRTPGTDSFEVIAVGPRRGQSAPLGVAVDLGTTKVAGYLLDLSRGAALAMEGIMNPQIAYGEDVMSRIAYALQGRDKAEQLRQAIVANLQSLIGELCASSEQQVSDVLEVVVVGNTAMHHLFLGLPVGQLGVSPYLPAVTHSLDVKARDVGLHLAPGAYVHLLPNIAGFVGADHVAVLLATRLYEMDKVVLALDIGTNTEVSLWAGGQLTCCSTASGPAFEGAHISQGMRAAKGAIERLRIADSRVEYQTIGDVAPVGLCGSGVLDAVAELLRAGVLDSRGAMAPDPRVRQGRKGPEFVLVSAEENPGGGDIVLTRGDVGEIQLAKGAIRAGISVLLKSAGIEAADVDKVILAGAFGTYIDVRNAVDIGMLPPLPLDRFSQVGNAAGAGARMALVSQAQREKAAEIAQMVDYIELTIYPGFSDEFMRAMYLGRTD
jgi:uncharacterized 2Fe-2S/4Fe-4S cluster protein (DUF4445 family)